MIDNMGFEPRGGTLCYTNRRDQFFTRGELSDCGKKNHLPLCRVASLQETIAYLQESGLQVLACDEKAKKYKI